MDKRADVTRWLGALRQGDAGAMDRLVPLVYDELRAIARMQLRRERSGHTLDTSGLVHEAFLRLVGSEADVDWQDRGHFFAIAARAMRHVLVDHARAHQRQKRGGGVKPLPLDEAFALTDAQADELVALNEALDHLAQLNERMCQVVEQRYFVGFSIDETAQALGVSPMTVKRDWQKARAFLARTLQTP